MAGLSTNLAKLTSANPRPTLTDIGQLPVGRLGRGPSANLGRRRLISIKLAEGPSKCSGYLLHSDLDALRILPPSVRPATAARGCRTVNPGCALRDLGAPTTVPLLAHQ